MKKMSETTIVVIVMCVLQVMVAGAMFKMQAKTLDEMEKTHIEIMTTQNEKHKKELTSVREELASVRKTVIKLDTHCTVMRKLEHLQGSLKGWNEGFDTCRKIYR